MNDTQPHGLLVNLTDAIRDVPQGEAQQAFANRFIALLAPLESRDPIKRGQWNLGARR